MSAAIDKGLSKLVSRKLLVWATATALMAAGSIESGDWVILSALYIGGQSVIDSIVKMRGAEK